MLMKLMLVLAMTLTAAGGLVRWILPQDEPEKLLKQTGYTLQEAIARAAKEAKEGLPVLAELEEEDGKAIYSIEFAQGSKIVEVNLDAKTGELVKKDTENEDKSEIAKACSFPLTKAIEIALQKIPGKAFEADAEISEGKGRIDVKILHEGKVRKVVIDGMTGEVVSVKSKKEDKE
jgi:uncharacterized membrane protein YkoI